MAAGGVATESYTETEAERAFEEPLAGPEVAASTGF
jgi:hypothetical protein